MTAVPEPLEHVIRPAPPWREEAKTECGWEVSKFARVLTRAEFTAKIRAQGRQRAAMSTCMTCLHAAGRHEDWAANPSAVLARSVSAWCPDEAVNRELQALALLVEAHPEEFAETLAALATAIPLRSRRTAPSVFGG